MSYYLKDFDKWISILERPPELLEFVEITDADVYGYADFTFICSLRDDGYFYDKTGTKMCAAWTIGYWKPIDL